MDFANNFYIERQILLMQCVVQVEYQAANGVHPMFPCVHVRRFFGDVCTNAP